MNKIEINKTKFSMKFTFKFLNNHQIKKESKYIKEIENILISNNEDFMPTLYERIDYKGTLSEKVNFQVKEKIKAGYNYILALNENNEVIGFTEVMIGETIINNNPIKFINVGTSAISKAFHGNGIAKMLYSFLDEFALKMKIDVIFRKTWSLNVKQLKLYEKFGYKEIERQVNARGQDNDLVRFCKWLKNKP